MTDGNIQIDYLSEDVLLGLAMPINEIIEILETLIRQSELNEVWYAPKAVITPPDGRYIMATLAVMDNPPLPRSTIAK